MLPGRDGAARIARAMRSGPAPARPRSSTDAIAAELEHHRHVGRGTNARVDDDGDPGAILDELEVVRVTDAKAGADRGGQRHDRRTAQIFQPAREDRIVVGIGKDGEPGLHELARRLQELNAVREQCLVVGNDLELQKFGTKGSRPSSAVRTASLAV